MKYQIGPVLVSAYVYVVVAIKPTHTNVRCQIQYRLRPNQLFLILVSVVYETKNQSLAIALYVKKRRIFNDPYVFNIPYTMYIIHIVSREYHPRDASRAKFTFVFVAFCSLPMCDFPLSEYMSDQNIVIYSLYIVFSHTNKSFYSESTLPLPYSFLFTT